MKKYKLMCLGTVLWVLSCITATWGFAAVGEEEDAHSGKIVFTPSIEASYRHDSNYYLEKTLKVSANTYVVKPGFEFGYSTPKSDVTLAYFLTANTYTGDDRVKNDDYYGHDLSLSAQTQATDHFRIGMSETYLKSAVCGSLNDLGAEINREKYQMNALSPTLSYAFNDIWSIDLKYTSQVVDYAENLNEDSVGNLGGFDLNYHLSPTSVLKLEYNIWNQDYDQTTPTYLSQEATLIYEKEYQFFFLSAGAGYHDRQFSDTDARDIDDVVWNLTLSGEAAKTRYYLSLDRNLNNFGQNQQYYKGITFQAALGYLFSEKIDMEVEFEYQKRNYVNDPKDEDLWETSAQFTYQFTPLLSSAVKYGYQERQSNDASREYNNSYIMVSVKWEFYVAEN